MALSVTMRVGIEQGSRKRGQMANKKPERGRRGAAGQRGETGATGQRGETGAAGQRGQTGATGQRGPQGERGPAGPPVRRADMLAVVDDQFNEIRKQLDLQLTRTGQLQQQLDQIHGLVKQLVANS